MPVLNPVVTKLTSSSTAMTDYMSAMFTHFGVSTKFSIVANGGVADAFTLTPIAAAETWQLNLRNINATATVSGIDPLANITSPGVAGGAAPTLTSDLEWSNETTTMEIAGTESVDFYIIELDDAFIVLFMDAGKTANPRAMLYGRVFVPYYTDGTNGNDYCDGLGMLGYIPEVTTSSGAEKWLNLSVGSQSKCRGFQNYTDSIKAVPAPGDQWFQPVAASVTTANADCADMNGNKKIFPYAQVSLMDTNSPTTSEDFQAGYTKYIAIERASQNPGVVLDGGAGNDAWVHVHPSGAGTFLLPWDRNVTPEF